jgi:hypothetical protein
MTKVHLFRRTDVAAVWAGDFRYAWLALNHLDAIFTASAAMRDRDIDVARAFAKSVPSLKQHLKDSTQPLIPAFAINRAAQEPERTTVLVGGYSLVEGSPVVLRIDWTPNTGRWDTGVSRLSPEDVVFIGDDRRHATQNARRARRYVRPTRETGWRMEPLAAIHRAIEDQSVRTVGGRLQLAKSYMHGATRAYGIVDSVRSSEICVLGHPVEARAARELMAARLVLDLSAWNLEGAAYARA